MVLSSSIDRQSIQDNLFSFLTRSSTGAMDVFAKGKKVSDVSLGKVGSWTLNLRNSSLRKPRQYNTLTSMSEAWNSNSRQAIELLCTMLSKMQTFGYHVHYESLTALSSFLSATAPSSRHVLLGN